MTKQEVWDSIITPEARKRIAKKSWREQLAEAQSQASLQRDQSDIMDAFAGDASAFTPDEIRRAEEKGKELSDFFAQHGESK